jgi:CIC family chloride channel protein
MADAPEPSSKTRSAKSPVRAWLDAASALVLQVLERARPSEPNRVFGVTLAVGGVCGLVAVSFHLAIRAAEVALVERALVLPGRLWIPAIMGLPTLGGLVSGALLTLFPKARGSGIPQVKAAYTIKTDKLRLRDAVAKFFISAIQIGTGSSLGREGPTVQICATVASSMGRLFALSPSNQRRLIPVGAAAGIAAAFNAPIAAVTFVTEELVGGLDTTVLSGVVIAAALAAVVEHSVLGEHPVFTVPGSYGLGHASSLLVFALLGLAAGTLGDLFVKALLGLRGRFKAMKALPAFVHPAVGGLVTGSLAVIALLLFHTPGVTGGGYNTLSVALQGTLPLQVFAFLCLAKWGATVMSYSSGGAGGIFAPSLFVGGMLGGLVGYLDGRVLGHGDAQLGAFALVGMGAFFAAVVRAPITSVLIIFEMTGSYRLVLPLMIANTIAYLIARRAQRLPVYDALLEQDGIVLPHAHTAQALSNVSIRQAMTASVFALDPESTVDSAIEIMRTKSYASFPVVDGSGKLLGVLTEGRLRRLVAEGQGATPLREHARLREYLHTGQSLRDALDAMNRLGVRQMAVVDDKDRERLAGILAMSDVMRALLATEAAPDSTARPSMTV